MVKYYALYRIQLANNLMFFASMFMIYIDKSLSFPELSLASSIRVIFVLIFFFKWEKYFSVSENLCKMLARIHQ